MAKGRPRQFDTRKALDIALKLFWDHGYEGTSIAMLAKAMGVNVPSLYAAFGGKQDLYLRAVDRYGELNGGMYHNSLIKATSYDVAESILMGEVELVTRRASPEGCFMVQSALVTGPDAGELRKKMNKLRASPIIWMRERFQRAKDEGDLPRDADPQALAAYIMSLNSGLAVMARSGMSRRQLEAVVAAALRGWPAPAGGKRRRGTSSRRQA